MLAFNLSFSRLRMDHVGTHFPNQSGWPGGALSCSGAERVRYTDVRATHAITAGLFTRCHDLSLANVSVEAEVGWVCGGNGSVTGSMVNVSPPACEPLRPGRRLT